MQRPCAPPQHETDRQGEGKKEKKKGTGEGAKEGWRKAGRNERERKQLRLNLVGKNVIASEYENIF